MFLKFIVSVFLYSMFTSLIVKIVSLLLLLLLFSVVVVIFVVFIFVVVILLSLKLYHSFLLLLLFSVNCDNRETLFPTCFNASTNQEQIQKTNKLENSCKRTDYIEQVITIGECLTDTVKST